jgi:hypothetical protein
MGNVLVRIISTALLPMHWFHSGANNLQQQKQQHGNIIAPPARQVAGSKPVIADSACD